MKGDGRARSLMKLLDEMPCGASLFKSDEPRGPTEEEQAIMDDADEESFQKWGANLNSLLDDELSDEDFEKEFGVQLPSDNEFVGSFERPKAGPTWLVTWTDDYGDRGTIDIAESGDLVRTLLLAKNRFRTLGIK
jgi:hypothetical protein